MQNFNSIVAQICVITFHKLNLLAEKNLPLKEKVYILIHARAQIIDNLNCCKQDILVLNEEINQFHLLSCFKMLKQCQDKVQICYQNLEKFKSEYNDASQYSNIIENIYYFYSSFYKNLKNFYNTNINKFHDIKKVDDFFACIYKSLLLLKTSYQKSDNAMTANHINDIQKEMQILFKTIKYLCQFMIVKDSLIQFQNTICDLIKKYNLLKTINEANKEILIRNQVFFEKNIFAFNKEFNLLNFQKAFECLLNAYSSYNKINVFVRTQIKAPEIIERILIVLDEQIKWIVANKEYVIKSLLQIKRYFGNKNIHQIVNNITQQIDYINLTLNDIQKINIDDENKWQQTINNLLSSSKYLQNIKTKIHSNFEELATIIKKNINFFSVLNDLYILQHQLLVYVNELFTKEKNIEYEKIILDNLDKINLYLQILLDEQEVINFKNIRDEIDLISKTTSKIISYANMQKNLCDFSTNLFVFANRYRTKNNAKLINAENMYKQKEFVKCLNILINVCRTTII